jgi:hypothetical protein
MPRALKNLDISLGLILHGHQLSRHRLPPASCKVWRPDPDASGMPHPRRHRDQRKDGQKVRDQQRRVCARPGRRHAETVALSCHAAGLRVRLLALPRLLEKGDLSDWLDAGHDRAELVALAEAAPAREPAIETQS